MSYVHSDDNRGRLTEFRERLGDEVHMQIGEEFSIFQDRKDILWGQNGEARIKESLDEVTFLILIITPSFFKSQPCRDELQRFLEREKELGRDDLVLSVYYVDCPLLNDKENRTGNELAQAIFDHHQYEDWRDMRFEPFTSPQVGKTLARLAVQIRDALDRVQVSEKRKAPEQDADVARHLSGGVSVPLPPDIASVIASVIERRGPTAKTEHPTRVVDQMHRGDHLTITEAIEAANPGDRILVRPGLYIGGLVIDKPGLEIIGDGNLVDVVVQAAGMDALLFKTTRGRVTNLTLRQMGGGDWFGVDIAQGQLELEECNITSHGLACVAIHSGADPRLRRNRIYNSKGESGVYVYESGQGALEDNEIFGNIVGVMITTGGNPTLRRNRIYDSKGESGVYVYENGQGVLEDNEIFGNAYAGVEISDGGNPILRRNRINENSHYAVLVYDRGGGTIEDNDLRGNAKGAWNVSSDSEPNLRRARNKE